MDKLTYEQRIAFLSMVRERVMLEPDLMGDVVNAVQAGVTDALREQRHHIADMESVAAVALYNRTFKGSERFIADKLRKNNHRSSMLWNDVIARLDAIVAKKGGTS